MPGALEAVHGLLEEGGQRAHAARAVFALQQIQCRNACRAGHGMGRIGIAVGKFHHVLRTSGRHELVIDGGRDHAGSQRLGAIADLLGDIHDVRRHAKGLGRRHRSEAAKARDDLVEDQQDVVLGADLAQTLQIAGGWNHHPARA